MGMGNWDLFVVVLAWQEWGHWLGVHCLDWSQEPFIALQEISSLSDRRLNLRECRWPLFLGRFNFPLSYRPRTRNIEADALSLQFSPNDKDFGEETILQRSCVRTHPAPLADCLSLILLGPLLSNGGKLLRLCAIRISIVPWNYYNSTFGGRVSPWTPGNSFLPAPSVPPTNLLFAPRHTCYIFFLFPIDPGPTLPWTLSWVDRPLRGKKTIFIIVDQFSKMVHIIPLPNLPLAVESPSLVQHVFWLHGIIPNRGHYKGVKKGRLVSTKCIVYQRKETRRLKLRSI